MPARCPACDTKVYVESLDCPTCAAPFALHPDSRRFVTLGPEQVSGDSPVMVDGQAWHACVNRSWQCNWLAPDAEGHDACLSCRLTRRRPAADDTFALERLAEASQDKRRLLAQLLDLGLPITPYYEREGGLAFDLLSSFSGERVVIGHAGGVITIDLAESLDSHREALRIALGEPYRTMLGHFRHEIGHYYQGILVGAGGGAGGLDAWDECRALFGDERASYREAKLRHYREGAPAGWVASYISEYATMHPWEDFAETFAHYLHITATLATAADDGTVLERSGRGGSSVVVPLPDYADQGIDRLLDDWHWLSFQANRVNRAMGARDLYPFGIVAPVRHKLAFIHRLVTTVGGSPGRVAA